MPSPNFCGFVIDSQPVREEYESRVNATTDGGSFALCCNSLVFIDSVNHDDHGGLWVVEIYKSKDPHGDFQVPADLGELGENFEWVKTVLFSDCTDAVNYYTAEIAGAALHERLRAGP
jgi:hypothetical protein